jgi:cytochrome c553
MAAMHALNSRRTLAGALAALAMLAAGHLATADAVPATRNRPPDPQRGAVLYAPCAACHGADGAGVPAGSTPRIAGQHYSVLLKQLSDFRTGRRQDFRMSERADQHHLADSRDLEDLAAYVHGLPAGGTPGMGDGSRATVGARIFGRQCASCHRADGSGDEQRVVPRLAGQHYSYLVRQMYDVVDRRRTNLDKVHTDKLAPLNYDEVRGIADYLSRIGLASPRAPAGG